MPADSIGFWADRLDEHGVEHERIELFGTERLNFKHPCGIDYTIVGDPAPTRASHIGRRRPRRARDPRRVRHDHLGARARAAVALPDRGSGRPRCSESEGRHHQFQIGDEQGHGRMLELVEEPDLPQGTWHFGEGTIHHHALDAVTPENQPVVKD